MPSKTIRQRRIAQGKCPYCARPDERPGKRCSKCLESDRQRAYEQYWHRGGDRRKLRQYRAQLRPKILQALADLEEQKQAILRELEQFHEQ